MKSGGQDFLKVENVTKAYETPEGVRGEVLKGVDLAMGLGESVAVVGPSGSGKSTLLNIIGALDQPTGGTVCINGKNISGSSDRELARIRKDDMGFVFQLHHLLPQCTVLENVLVPSLVKRSSGNAEERARKLLDRAGLGERLQYRPGQLSGGECQRVAVIRALINEPKLLLADEPTGSLDRAAAESLSDLLLELNREEKVALLVVTHSMALAGKMDKCLELLDGKLKTAGN
jgi:ABC-type lipoprotein export system ATPase subunit